MTKFLKYLIIITVLSITAITYGGVDFSGTTHTYTTGDSMVLSGNFTDTATGSIGWSLVSSANQSCNTTCTNACVFGQDLQTLAITNCTNAIADNCTCAGGS
jgi:hypothetical protein